MIDGFDNWDYDNYKKPFQEWLAQASDGERNLFNAFLIGFQSSEHDFNGDQLEYAWDTLLYLKNDYLLFKDRDAIGDFIEAISEREEELDDEDQ